MGVNIELYCDNCQEVIDNPECVRISEAFEELRRLTKEVTTKVEFDELQELCPDCRKRWKKE